MMPPLQSLAVFETVARRKSFALAAQELNLTPSAVSHRLKNLEKVLGVQLLERSGKGVFPTPIGEGYLTRLTVALGAISSATDDLRQGLRKSLYVHVSPSLASLWLMPRLPQFTQSHPEVSLFLSSSHVHSDFALGQVDLDIRYGLPSWRNLEAIPLFNERILPLVSPSFIKRHDLKQSTLNPSALLGLPLIQSTVSLVQWRDWFSAHAQDVDASSLPERFSLRFDRAMMSLDAAMQGMGVALESDRIAQSHIGEGRLVPLFGRRKSVTVQAHFAVYPARHADRIEVKQFLSWLKSTS
jgi:DNA-binding transcriptional LysR family regulator